MRSSLANPCKFTSGARRSCETIEAKRRTSVFRVLSATVPLLDAPLQFVAGVS